ncbi:MAG: acetyl ornithine aminotransferase family protein, partial [Ardenticatenaceae bacterium]
MSDQSDPPEDEMGHELATIKASTKPMPAISSELPGRKTQALIKRDAKVVSKSYTRSYPFAMQLGEGAWVWDLDGNKFLDLTCGIGVTNLGHSHPRVNTAIKQQVDHFLHMAGTDFYYQLQVELAEELARITPGDGAKRVFFTNSGTESIEAALKLARKHTGRPKVISFVGSFHGRTYGSLSLSVSKPIHRQGYEPLLSGMIHVPYGYCYRCPINLTYPQCEIDCIDYIERHVFRHLADPHEVAAIFVEPMQGEGGYVLPPLGWHGKLRALCDKYGILLVADEVQSGMGRTGKFFAMEHFGVVADITCIAKGIANGLPLGAIVAKAEVMDWKRGSHANTFGGNPVACAAAVETIRIIEEEELLDNALSMGKRLMVGLNQLAEEHPTIGDVRGLGLMVGAELIDPQSGQQAKTLRDLTVNHAYHMGALLLGAGPATLR